MSAKYDCEIFFPRHEVINESWAFHALSKARFAWREERGFNWPAPQESQLTQRDGQEQWSYKCTVTPHDQ